MEAEGSEFPAFEFNIVTSRTGGKGLRSRENSSVGMLSGFFGQLLNSSGIVFRNYTRGIRMNRVPSADIHLTWQLRSQGIWRSVRCIAESVYQKFQSHARYYYRFCNRELRSEEICVKKVGSA